MRRNPDKMCEHCGKSFHPYRATLRFCSNECSSQAQYVGHSREAICVTCGAPFISRNKDNGSGRHWTKCCSRECAGKIHFKGEAAASRRRRRYGMEPEVYDCLVEQQGGACALCGQVPEYPLYVDHCHATKRNRGLVCGRCNQIVGVMDELSEDEIQRYRDYAERSEI